VCETIGSEWTDAKLSEFRHRSGTAQSGGRIVPSSVAFHHARLVEVVACLEGIEQLVVEGSLMIDRIRASASLNANRAVGVSEARRGNLFHHYCVDDDGLIARVNLNRRHRLEQSRHEPNRGPDRPRIHHRPGGH